MPSDWREFSQQAREALLAAERIERDDLAVQYKLRCEALEFAVSLALQSRDAHSADNNLAVGDRVTCPGWGGDTAVISRIEDQESSTMGVRRIAFFKEGGFWRISQLRRVSEARHD